MFRNQIHETTVIHNRDAVHHAIGNATRLEVSTQGIDLETSHRTPDLCFYTAALGCTVHGIFDEQNRRTLFRQAKATLK